MSKNLKDIKKSTFSNKIIQSYKTKSIDCNSFMKNPLSSIRLKKLFNRSNNIISCNFIFDSFLLITGKIILYTIKGLDILNQFGIRTLNSTLSSSR